MYSGNGVAKSMMAEAHPVMCVHQGGVWTTPISLEAQPNASLQSEELLYSKEGHKQLLSIVASPLRKARHTRKPCNLNLFTSSSKPGETNPCRLRLG